MFCAHCNLFITSWSSTLDSTAGSKDVRWLPFSYTTYENIAALRESSDAGCIICRNAWFTLTTREQQELDIKASLKLEVMPDGSKPMLRATFIPPHGQSTSRTLALYYMQDAPQDVSNIIAECATMDQSAIGLESTFRLANFWLSRCLKDHDKCPKSNGFLPSRVIDVQPSNENAENHVKLIETSELDCRVEDTRYIALSHCWGKPDFLITTKATLAAHKAEIKFDYLPLSFQDAITTVRRLGLRYLWIDSLCIIQDSAEDWQHESAQMCNVYANSLFTITSAHASSARGGMFRKRDGVRVMPFEIALQVGSKPVRMLYMPSGQREVQWDLNGLPIYTRAWCFQEMMLPTRNLIFDMEGIRWECLTTSGTERQLDGESSRHNAGVKLVQRSIKGLNPGNFDGRGGITWQSIVKDYTERNLTKHTDRLIAIVGVAQELEAHLNDQYLAGLWRRHLATTLCWYVRKRIENDEFDHTGRPYPGAPPYREPDAIAPSWSWASVNWRVDYDFSGLQEDMCEIIAAEVDGPPHAQTGRLTIHGDTRVLYVPNVQSGRMSNLLDISHKYHYVNEHSLKVRLFQPNQVMLATSSRPTLLSRTQVLPVMWLPDDIYDERHPITFLALKFNPTKSARSIELRRQHLYTLALAPTGNIDEFRRVGLAIWADCSWFGYQCAEDHSTQAEAWAKLNRSFHGIKEPELSNDGNHTHPFDHGLLANKGHYHVNAKMVRRTLHIV